MCVLRSRHSRAILSPCKLLIPPIYVMGSSLLGNPFLRHPRSAYFLLKGYSRELIQNNTMRKLPTLRTLLLGDIEGVGFLFGWTDFLLDRPPHAPSPRRKAQSPALQHEQQPAECLLPSGCARPPRAAAIPSKRSGEVRRGQGRAHLWKQRRQSSKRQI